jgi:hypothetical protein
MKNTPLHCGDGGRRSRSGTRSRTPRQSP